MREICLKTVEALLRRGYEAEFVPTGADALSAVMKEAQDASSVGWGGSETLKEIGARDALLAAGKTICDHQTVMDLFLLSANAVTDGGVIVNIDGTGNRIAASIYGPKRVVYVIGRNKIVSGGVAAAVERAKRSGVSYVAQPGGSIRDDQVIETCDLYDMVMSFTHMRLFHH